MRTLLLFFILTTSALALTSNEFAQLQIAVGSVTNATGLDAVKVRQAIVAVSVASTSNRLDVTTRDADLVFQEKTLNAFAALRGFNPTNSEAVIYGTYSNLIVNAATPDDGFDKQNEWLAVKAARQLIILQNGDFTGTTLRSNTVVVVTYTQPLWPASLGVPQTADIERCWYRPPPPEEP